MEKDNKIKYLIQRDIEGNKVLKSASTGETINTFAPDFTEDAIVKWVDTFMSKINGDTTAFDVVKKPSHYNSGRYEVIDIIQSVLDSLKLTTAFQAYCLGNSLKYICRAGLKGDFKEDIKKAIMYLTWAIGEDPRK